MGAIGHKINKIGKMIYETKDTMAIGDVGEDLGRNLLSQYYFPIQLRNKDWRYDDLFAIINGVEYKTQLNAVEYGGYSVEIGDSNARYFKNHDSICRWGGMRYYPTALSTTEANYYMFTDTKVAYFIKTNKLKEMTKLVSDRIKFGGSYKSSLQWQIKISELEKYAHKVFFT